MKRMGDVMSVRKGFTLIELMIVVAIIAVIAATAIPNLLSSRMASNESAAIAGLRAYLGAQGTFQRADRYEIGSLVYANTTDGVGYQDMFEIGYAGAPTADAIKLVDLAFANAAFDYADKRPKAGFQFDDIESDAISGNDYDYTVDCGLSAGPAQYARSGLHAFVIDLTGTVYKIDSATAGLAAATGDEVTPPVAYPDTTTDNWLPVGS